jgi:superfamily II DNA helicase RecQ
VIQAHSIVLLSPEIALSDGFKRKVLTDPSFQKKLALVAIDEVHVVSEWGKTFRRHYSQLELLRRFIGKDVPWLGCSATLDPVMLEEVQKFCGFDSRVRVQRVSVDRPDIFISLRPIQHSVNSLLSQSRRRLKMQPSNTRRIKLRRHCNAMI